MDNYNESTWSSHLTIQTFCSEAICSWNAQKVKASNPFWISKILLLREWDGMDQVTDYSFQKPSVHNAQNKINKEGDWVLSKLGLQKTGPNAD